MSIHYTILPLNQMIISLNYEIDKNDYFYHLHGVCHLRGGEDPVFNA